MSIHPGLLGKYELRERLGQGGMAEVWKAYDQRLQRFVAIKFLHSMLQADPAFLARFVREARAVASLRHPNIVQVYDFETATPGAAVGKDQPLAYMVMDYIEGQTLADYLAASVRARSFLSPQEIVSLFYSISSAVDYAHQRGLLHRDIKPSNILLDRRHTERNPMGEPVLTDFGIVKIQGSAAGTLTSSAMGTPLYIAPEQALGQPLDASSDVYSLGVMLYEVCAGDLPFSGPTPVAIVQQHIMEPPPPPSRLNPAISPELEAVILRALAKKPAERFPSALALTSALAAALRIPLPAWQSQPISSPDLRDLSPADSTLLVRPASAVAGSAAGQDETAIPAPTLQSGLGAPSFSDDPTALSERPHLPTQYVDPLPAPVLAQPMQRTTPAEVASGSAVKQLPLTPPISPAQAPASSPITPLPPVERTPASRKRRGVLALISLVLLLLILGSGLAVFLRLRSQTGATATQAVGRAFFTSSGDGSGMDNQGLNDVFQVRLTGIPAPAAGNQYYAWLLPDQIQAEASARALGPLTISGGVAALHAPYVDPQHANLVALFSRFLVTEEPINPAPQSPSLDTAQWRYEGAIPQSASASDCPATAINQLSVLCHLRHLLSNDPELMRVNLRGGLNYWFLNNVKELQKWSTEAVDHQ
ncbi:MAG TPA: serine/threonine-protein kinase, partial [Ktedonobacteraceae bacterium]|nr:serine/threonine-protein kinase [Ktedonobacteraceae bacterium]